MAESLQRLDFKDIILVLIILVLAFSVGFWYFTDYAKTDIFPVLSSSDSYSYYLWAKDIASGDLVGRSAFMKWPLYAYFLAFLFKVAGDNIPFVYMFQLILGAINCCLIYFIAKKIFNRPVAFISALLCVGYGFFLFYDGLLIYTSLSLLLNSLLFLYVLRIRDSVNRKNSFLFGLFLGICVLAQGNIIIFGIFAIVWLILKDGPGLTDFVYQFFAFVLGLSIILGVSAARNYLAEKDFVLLTGNMGVNFYLGNNPHASGGYSSVPYLSSFQEGMFKDARVIVKVETGQDLKTSQVSKFWFKKSLDFIKNNPKYYLGLLLKKIEFLLSPEEPVHDQEFPLLEGKISVCNNMLMNLRLILPLCLLGVILNIKRIEETAPLYIILFSFSLSLMIFFVTTRYRIALVPFAMIFASSALYNIWKALKERRYFVFGLMSTFLILLVLILNFDVFLKNKLLQSERNLSISKYYLDRGIHFSKLAYYDKALEELKKSKDITPYNHNVYFSLGAVYYARGDLKLAESAFLESIKIFPYFVDGLYNLGLLYNQEQRFEEARSVLERAVYLDPEDVGSHYELGRAYKALGNKRKAKEEFELALKKINRWRTEERSMIQKEMAGF